VTIGDFSSTTVDGSFSLVYLVYNTIENLMTQAAQVACFRSAAAHLEPGGFFVIEVEVPQLRRLPPGDTFRVFSASKDYFGIDEIDVATQRAISHHLSIVDGARPIVHALPLRLALGTRSHGAACWDELLRAMGRLEPRAVHERESEAHLGVGEPGTVNGRTDRMSLRVVAVTRPNPMTPRRWTADRRANRRTCPQSGGHVGSTSPPRPSTTR